MEQFNTVREAVGVFDAPDKLDAAVADLEGTSFSRMDISVLGSTQEMEEKYGSSFRTEWLEDNSDAPRDILIRPEEKVIGASFIIGCCAYTAGCVIAIGAKTASTFVFLMAIAGGSIGGALIGAVIVSFIASKLSNKVAQQLRKGGLLLWVRTLDPQKEKIAQDILTKHGARHVHIHSIAA